MREALGVGFWRRHRSHTVNAGVRHVKNTMASKKESGEK